MKKYLPAKRAMICAYLVLAALGALLSDIFFAYADMMTDHTFKLIAGIMWIVILTVALLFIPHYFFHAKTIITQNEIAASGGFLYFKDDYMPIGSIKSVSVIFTPFGYFTGFNFVVINALGSRIVLAFLKQRDARDIAATVNSLIAKNDAPETLPAGGDGK